MKFIGHKQVVAALLKDLPSCTLLQGPDSVGKTTLARAVFKHKGIEPELVERLRMDVSRQISADFFRAPMSGLKGAVICLDDATSEASNALLKLLEEPPDYVRFILTASKPVLPTIKSRCQTYDLGYLRDAEVEAVLVGLGWQSDLAAKAAQEAAGQVSTALGYNERQVSKGPVLACLRAIKAKDAELLKNALARFSDANGDMMKIFLTEARSRRWRIFSPDSTDGVPEKALRRLEIAMTSGARPKLAVRHALGPLVVK